ncbi:SDR family NAD(P)-dependent oxidoreductase [Sphingomonas jatrophae]|uniref:NAD(P)-dependent dehydrogenase, short-chain alcohol dehydrogenase family n=1 Tax=Sphingomonas jatrophae TaxID=1166337 RepID=A0A1I6KFW0_9SPHN|nr:SDR family oxidoreductase [Sphingomonas jatrophae]SFR90119.1 NAD(P)-dependent dehydrogenase, short-chain alcohol dehydrogenase family [Sphingomonas jatrophae]
MPLSLTFRPGAILVSGGTGRVGEGVVRRLAEGGVPVLFTYRHDRDRAAAIERELCDAGHRVRAKMLDLSSPASIDAAFEAARSLGGGIAAVVSAGGPGVPFAKLADVPAVTLEAFLRADAMGIFRLVSRAVTEFRAVGGGPIVVCTTIANFRVVDFDGASPFSKGAVEALIRQVAAEEAGAGITCNGVAVSWVNDLDADAQIAAVADMPEPAFGHIVALIRQIEAQTRAKRPARTSEAGDLFAFLASEQARYVTGETVRFDGGFSL